MVMGRPEEGGGGMLKGRSELVLSAPSGIERKKRKGIEGRESQKVVVSGEVRVRGPYEGLKWCTSREVSGHNKWRN